MFESVAKYFRRFVVDVPTPVKACELTVAGGAVLIGAGVAFDLGHLPPQSSDPLWWWLVLRLTLLAGVILFLLGLISLFLWALSQTGRSIRFVRAKAGSIPRVRVVLERPGTTTRGRFGKPVEPVPWAGQILSETGGHYEVSDPILPPKSARSVLADDVGAFLAVSSGNAAWKAESILLSGRAERLVARAIALGIRVEPPSTDDGIGMKDDYLAALRKISAELTDD